MKNYTYILAAVSFWILLAGCATQEQLKELSDARDYYKAEAEANDSIKYTNNALSEKLRFTEGQLKKTTLDLEQYAVSNQSIKKNYEEVLQRYNQLLTQNKDMLATSSYEKQNLQEQLAANQSDLDLKARELATMEYNLSQRESRIMTLEGSYDALEGDVVAKNKRIRELEALAAMNENSMKDLRAKIDNALRGFTAADLTVEDKNGKLYVSLSQELLFKSGSATIDWKGRQAITQIAGVLNANPEIEIMVEGHTDTDGTADKNWDLSVLRATSVVKVLVAGNVDPKRITAAGRGFYIPVASNTSATGKSQNRRTEIILSPKLDALYEILKN